MSRLDRLENAATLELQSRLAEWESSDRKFDGREWDDESRQGCLAFLQAHPSFVPTVVELAKFGSVDALQMRYKSVLNSLVREGLITCDDAEKSAVMACSGKISIAQVIAEGKVLKKWLESEREKKGIHAALTN